MADLSPAPDGYPIKLVRDHTAEIINSTGVPGDLFYGPIAPQEDRWLWLKKKLGEEVFEYILDGNIDELADVVAVVMALAEYEGASLDELVEIVRNDRRGGFWHGQMMYGRHEEFDRGSGRNG